MEQSHKNNETNNISLIDPELALNEILNNFDLGLNKKPIILNEGKQRFTGRLKFFDENKNYGFIVRDDDNSDIFVHFDDLVKARISKDLLRAAKMGFFLRFSFSCMSYIGKYNKSKKAVDLKYLP